MAVVREYRCDLCGEYVKKDDVQVFRVGTTEDRPDGCYRLDIGTCCLGRTVADVIVKYAQERRLTEDGIEPAFQA